MVGYTSLIELPRIFQLTLLSIATFLPFVLGQQLAHGLPPNPRPGPHPFPPPQGPTPAPFAGATPVFSAAPFQPLTPTPQVSGKRFIKNTKLKTNKN